MREFGVVGIQMQSEIKVGQRFKVQYNCRDEARRLEHRNSLQTLPDEEGLKKKTRLLFANCDLAIPRCFLAHLKQLRN
jgi:hypothetical protein